MTQEEEYIMAHEAALITFEKINALVPEKAKKRESLLYEKLSGSKYNSVNRLSMLFQEMEYLYAHIAPYVQCKKGCDMCCRQEIAVSQYEVEYIVKNTKAKLKKDIEEVHPTQACPFLTKGRCGIYKHRPFMCRRHFSIANSSRWCNFDVANKYEFPLVSFSEVDKCYALLIVNRSEEPVKDIRTVFKRF